MVVLTIYQVHSPDVNGACDGGEEAGAHCQAGDPARGGARSHSPALDARREQLVEVARQQRARPKPKEQREEDEEQRVGEVQHVFHVCGQGRACERRQGWAELGVRAMGGVNRKGQEGDKER